MNGNHQIIGKGSSAVVYALSEDVCMKTIHTRNMLTDKQRSLIELLGVSFSSILHDSLARECLREAATMMDLADCPQVVRIISCRQDACENEDGYVTNIVMERLTPLSEKVKEADLTLEDVVTLAKDICQALIRCQEAGIIHQDIKPANIFCTADGHYKLGDFGIAVKSTQKNKAGTSGGTVNTMAPEVYAGLGSSFRSDIYSLGLVLYRLMNHGWDPFIKSSAEQALACARLRSFKLRMSGSPFNTPAGADDAFARIILKACAYDPDDRYQSAAEMFADLEQL